MTYMKKVHNVFKNVQHVYKIFQVYTKNAHCVLKKQKYVEKRKREKLRKTGTNTGNQRNRRKPLKKQRKQKKTGEETNRRKNMMKAKEISVNKRKNRQRNKQNNNNNNNVHAFSKHVHGIFLKKYDLQEYLCNLKNVIVYKNIFHMYKKMWMCTKKVDIKTLSEKNVIMYMKVLIPV